MQLPDEDVLDAIGRLFQALVDAYGPVGTLGILVVVVALFTGWRMYQDYRSGKEYRALTAEKERTIQRLAEDNRLWRTLYLKEEHGWTDEQVNQFVLRNELRDPADARLYLEDRDDDSNVPTLSRKKREKQR